MQWLVLLILAFFPPAMAHATAVVPSFDTVGQIVNTSGGPLGEPTFHGSGLPDNPAVIREFTLSSGFNVRIAMVVGPAMAGLPPVTDDGAGTYTVEAGIAPNYCTNGVCTGFLGPTSLQLAPYAKWDVGYYLQVLRGGGPPIEPRTSTLLVELLYDDDPSPNTMIDQFGVFDTSLYFAAFGGNYLGYTAGLTLQGAENLASTYLRGDPIYGGIIYDDPVYGIRKTITGPGGGISVFDPHAIGEYGWALRVSDGTVSGQVSMLVNTVQPVPLPSAFPMLALALMCLALARQRRIGR